MRRAILIGSTFAILTLCLVYGWHRSRELAGFSSPSVAVLEAERVDIAVDADASPDGQAFRYTVSDESVIRDISHTIEKAPSSQYLFGEPAIEGTVTVMPFAKAGDETPVAYITLCFNGTTYFTYGRDDLGIRVLNVDSKNLYQQLAGMKSAATEEPGAQDKAIYE